VLMGVGDCRCGQVNALVLCRPSDVVDCRSLVVTHSHGDNGRGTVNRLTQPAALPDVDGVLLVQRLPWLTDTAR
jgi:hypothetical protein